jgi:hypothetical protein
MYLGASIKDPRRYLVAHDVIVRGYLGGENTVAFDMNTFRQQIVRDTLSRLPVDGPSLLYFMVPADSLFGNNPGKAPLTHDIRGFSERVGSAAPMHADERPHYMSAFFYNTALGLNAIKRPGKDDWYSFVRNPTTNNTVTHQGVQRFRHPQTGVFELPLPGSDPFGNAVYPGMRALRRDGLPGHYEKTNYKDSPISV